MRPQPLAAPSAFGIDTASLPKATKAPKAKNGGKKKPNSWLVAVAKARAEGHTGALRKGTDLYARAKEIHAQL